MEPLVISQSYHLLPSTNRLSRPSAVAPLRRTCRNYNNELVKSIEDLREKREELNRQILKDHLHWH